MAGIKRRPAAAGVLIIVITRPEASDCEVGMETSDGQRRIWRRATAKRIR
jgi:hypothetical protein